MTRAAGEYAEALYGLARDEGLADRFLEELTAVGGVLREAPEWLRILTAANLPKEERCGLVDQAFRNRVHPYVLNLMKILTEKGCARQLPACCDAYRGLYNEDHGILTVKAVSAMALTEAQRQRLTDRLEKLTGRRIDLRCAVDADCLGGLRLDYDGKRVEDTVRQRLDAVRSALENAML